MRSATILLSLSAGSLMAFGMVMLYSAAMVQKGAHYMMMQAMWGAAGLAACIFMASIDYRRWKRFYLAPALWIVALVLLALVWKYGVIRNHSRRWFDLHVGFFQPSEAAKFALILFVAWYAERSQRFMNTFWRGVAIPLAAVGVGLALIYVEPDRGTTILLGGLLCLMLLLAGARWWQLALVVLVGIILFKVSLSHDNMRSDRIRAWKDPEKFQSTIAYQQWQSILAIGNGGVEGLGLGNGRQKLGFIPEHHTDFIFSVVAEELGFYASLAVICAFAVFLVSGICIAWYAQDLFGFLIASGVTFLIGMQSFINMAVVTNLIPNKGMALPFMSYGGSSLLVTLAMVGMLLSVAAHRESASNELEAEDLIDSDLTAEAA